jgi:hypothetical protein
VEKDDKLTRCLKESKAKWNEEVNVKKYLPGALHTVFNLQTTLR